MYVFVLLSNDMIDFFLIRIAITNKDQEWSQTAGFGGSGGGVFRVPLFTADLVNTSLDETSTFPSLIIVVLQSNKSLG